VKRLGLRARLTLIFSLVFAGILVLVTAVSYHILKFRLDDSLQQELRERAAGLRGYLHFQDGKPRLEYDANDFDEAFFVETSTRYYQVFNLATGDMVDQSHELDLLDLNTDPENVRAIQGHKTFSIIDAGAVKLLFHSEIVRAPGGQSFLVQIGTRRDPIDAALKQFLLMALFVAPVGLAIASAASWWMAGKALQPVRALTQAAKEIGISGLDSRLPLRGTGDELDRLSITFNEMFARLAKAIGEMRQFTASISHELRTPLTVLQGEAEVMLLQPHSVQEYRRLLASHLEEYDRLARLINRLLTLARAEAGDIQLHPTTVDLAQLSRYIVDQLDAVASSKQISLSVKSSEPVYVHADREWLESAILNLLDNAIKFTPEGGNVTIVAENRGTERKLEIQDTGIGIEHEALQHIFERFYRADPSRNNRDQGAGLGLSLVQWIIEQHRGHVDVRSEPGKGSQFTIWLPAETSSAANADAASPKGV
jgi:two-component system, OmpR family, sensor kinase